MKKPLTNMINDELDYSQTYMRNKRLPRADIEFSWTPEMLSEIKKCKKDIIHFAETYFHIVTLDEGKQKIELYPSQKRILKALQKYRFNVINSSRQFGKALALDTPIPTPSGWTTMGELKDGDILFNSKGESCNVIKAHEIMYNRPCYKILFDNGEEITADEEHLWFTQNRTERYHMCEGTIKTTKQIYDTLYAGSKKEPNHRISTVAGGVNYSKRELPIDPYVLGLWLGDGANEGAQITAGKRDVFEIVNTLKQRNQFDEIIVTEYKNNVYGVRPTTKNTKKITSLNTLLKQYNLTFNKHIPDDYMLSDRNQRLDLLKGLIDSDGYIDQKGNCRFYNTNIELAKQTEKLIRSLGYKTTYREYIPTLNGISCSKVADVRFTPREDVCTISFKTQRIKHKEIENISKYRNQWNYIKKIEKLENSVPVRCITVDSPDSLYLIGNTFIKTHNTTLTSIYALWLTCFDDYKRVVIVANKESTAIMILRRVALAYENLPNWLKPGVDQYGKKEILFGNGSGIAISTTTGSAVRGDTVNCIIIDEAAHIEDHLIKDFWASVIPVISSSKKRTTKIFMTSTPKGTGNVFHEIYTKALKNEDDNNMKWHAEEVHWYDQPGRGKLWKQDMIEALHGDKMLFEQEFNCAFLETGDSAIDMDLLNDLESSCRPAYQVFEDGHYNVWKEPAPGHIYGMGVDVGEGIGKAASVIQVLDFTDLTDIQQVAVYSDRFIHPTRFADIINRVGHHFGCPPVLIERNNIGSEVIAVLKEIHQYENIVSYNPENLLYGDIRPGVLSHSNTKFNGVMNMRYWLNACKVVKLYDIASVLELKTFVRYPNGTWKKKQGDNIFDDRVMALVWCLFLLNDNIAERYYDIVEEDDNGKPLKLAAYVINQPGMFKLDPFFQQTPNAPMPSFFDMSPDDGLNELRYQGWHNLQ